MLSLFRAECSKIVGHRWVVGFLLWVFPVGALAFLIVMGVLLAVVPNAKSDASVQELGLDQVVWTEQAVVAWNIPNSLLGRLMLLGFSSVVFAGEFQWKTWKNVLPRSERVQLVLVKFVAVVVLVVITFVVMSIIVTVGVGVLAAMVGESYGTVPTRTELAEFGRNYVRQAWLSATLAIISTGYAALAAMVTRSILGGVLVSVVATYVEGLSILGLILIGHFTGVRRMVELYRLMPSYNIANVSSWINKGRPPTDSLSAELLGDAFSFDDTLMFSLFVLALWVLGLVGITTYLFQKQDIT